MAEEGPPAPSPRTPGTAAPPEEPAVEAETLQDPSQTAQDSAATRQGRSCCSEEFILSYTFMVCDPEQTGTVLAWRVVEYLQAVTGQSSEEGPLRALHRMLDPEAAGAALDLPTFRAIMREWIASCQQEGGPRFAEERDVAAGDLGLVLAAGGGDTAQAAAQLEGDGGNTDIMSPTEATGLRRHAKQLAAQNTKLQQDVKLAEELNIHLAEETTQLKAQLRCSQQALEQARATAKELEDLKAMTRGLEEENSELRWQARQLVRGPASSLPVSPRLPPSCQAGMRGTSSDPNVFPPQEREQRCLSLQANSLQEEVRTPPGAMGKGACPGSAGVVVNASPFCPKQNQQLVAEGCELRQQIQALSANVADLEVQVTCCIVLLASQGVALAQVGLRVEELAVVLEEHDRVVQELHLEMMRVCNQLGRMQVPWAMLPWCLLGEADVPAQPLSAEIAATCQGTGEAEEDVGTAAPGDVAGDGEEPAEPQQCPGPSESRLPRTLPALPSSLVLLLLVLLLALLCLLPRRGLGLPSGMVAWPQFQLRHQRPPPL
ncbi:protein KASH5 [Buteo buteo]|uniref:protein KASH5 n=1 Tax=Buteo buteo TaxID=30397 RepID=UPI003EBF1390